MSKPILAGVLLSLFASGTLLAQDEEDVELAKPALKEAESAPPAAPAPAELGSDDAAAAEGGARAAAVSAIGLELLSGSAFPSPQVRGIKGGSLAMNMHGLQWPYLPALAGEP